jgi:hypothetical protein
MIFTAGEKAILDRLAIGTIDPFTPVGPDADWDPFFVLDGVKGGTT